MKNKISVLLLSFMAIIFLSLDVRLFNDIQSIHQNRSTLPSAKSVMIDHLNSYVMSPLTRSLESLTHFTQRFPKLTANEVSYFGVFVALIAAKVVVNESLLVRRAAVLIFLVRQFVDDLDGLVARVRMGVDKNAEVSIVGTSGYAVDGICDAIGFTAFLLAVLVFSLRKRKNDSKYKLLDESRDDPHSTRLLFRNHTLFGFQMLLSCVLWNRYIEAFHRILETDVNSIKVEIFKSRLQWIIMWAWRCFGNAHQLMNFLLISVWLNKSQQFVHSVRLLGFVLIIGLSFLTEVHLNDIENYLKHISMNNKY